jgi:hypothetical protein
MAAVIGQSNPDVYAQMRGETMEEFQKSRNVSMQYSVAGGEERKSWQTRVRRKADRRTKAGDQTGRFRPPETKLMRCWIGPSPTWVYELQYSAARVSLAVT